MNYNQFEPQFTSAPQQTNEVATVTPVQNTKKSNLVLVFVLTIILSLIIGAGGVLLLFKFKPNLFNNSVTNITKTQREVTVTDTGIADAVEKIYDSVVVVKTYVRNDVASTGTGFVYKKSNNKYYFITNYHVIEDGEKVGVVFTDGTEASVVVEGGDKYADIAILSYATSKEIQVSEIGSSEKMRVGDTVFAIGAPLDSSIYSNSVTRGVLSGKDREVEVSTNNSYVSDWIMQVLQTDAAINSGNSGGPLCNSNGQVIGITNMKLVTDGVEGMGFAIPIEQATSFADQIINGQNVSRPYIGISMVDANVEAYAREYGIKPCDGVLIGSVEANSPAEKAGLKAGDVIVGMNDVDIKNVATLRYQLYKYKTGEVVTVSYLRSGSKLSTKLTLGSQ